MEQRRHRGPAKASWSIVGSLVAHLIAVGGVGWIAYRSLAAKEAREAERRAVEAPTAVIAIELPGVAEGTLVADRDVIPEGTAPSVYGGATVARLDTGSPGSGGDVAGARATNLAAMNDEMKLDPDPTSRLDRDQVQRLRTASRRTTHEDRRATTHPMELTFLATGKGERPERRPDSPADPSRGSRIAGAPAVLGGHVGSGAPDEQAPGSSPGADRAGQLFGSPGVGVRDGRSGADHREAARVARARPAVAEGAPTIPGIWNGRPNDTVDSDQEVASTVQSLIHASVAGGLAGAGRGGSASPAPDPGAGGGPVGRGSVAKPLGSGDGDLVDWNTNDPLLVPYFRKVHAKVDPLWANAFPKSAMLELKQGTVILEFTIASDGSAKVTWPPVRTSGIDEFDRNCADAIRRASPFEPIPAVLKEAGRTTLRIRAPFVAANPIIK
ncbi:MAG: TonB family protein [Labilithrix sp.]|nr:TonB family protein [Labilithrix sp.]